MSEISIDSEGLKYVRFSVDGKPFGKDYPIPKSTSKKKRKEMLEHRLRPTVKPDLDNVAKLIYDALNGVAWYDDNAIVDARVQKFYSDEPRVEVSIHVAE